MANGAHAQDGGEARKEAHTQLGSEWSGWSVAEDVYGHCLDAHEARAERGARASHPYTHLRVFDVVYLLYRILFFYFYLIAYSNKRSGQS